MNRKIKGGYTSYSQDIGIMMIPTKFPRIKGDIGNASTFNYPVTYKLIKGVHGNNLSEKNVEERLLKPFVDAAKSLESQGCKAITTSCSFLCGFQEYLADAVNIPVFTSSLILAPIVKTMLKKQQPIGIFTLSPELMHDDIFRQSGWTTKDISVAVSGLDTESALSKMIIDDQTTGDLEQLEKDIISLTEKHMKQYPDTGAIILECPNLAPFLSLIHETSQVPVFSINQLVDFISATIRPEAY